MPKRVNLLDLEIMKKKQNIIHDLCRFYITGKYRDYAYGDCNIKVKLRNKVLLLFHNLKKSLTYKNQENLILKLLFILNGLKKYMSFNINKKLLFIDILIVLH